MLGGKPSTTTRSRCASSTSRSCRPRCRRRRSGATARPSPSNGASLILNAPSLTIEAKRGRPVRVKWINDLVDADGTSCPTCCRSTRRCTGRTRPADRRATSGRPSRRRPVPYTGRSRSSPTSTAPWASPTRATATPRRGTCPRRATSPGYATEGTLYDFFEGKERRATAHAGTRVRRVPVSQPRPRVHALVPRPHARHDPPQRLRRSRRASTSSVAAAGDGGARHAVRTGPRRAARAGADRERSVEQDVLRDPDRHPGPLVQRRRARCSIPTRGRSSTSSPARTSRNRMSRRSGTPSSSATRSSSTATPGRS